MKRIGNSKSTPSEAFIQDSYNQILQNVPTGIVIYDENKNIVFANKLGAYYLGYSSVEELIQDKDIESARQRFHSNFKLEDEFAKAISVDNSPVVRAFNGEMTPEVIVHFYSKTKYIDHWVLNRAVPLFDKAGNVNGVVSSITDITEQKKAELEAKMYEEQFRAIFFQTEVPMSIADMQGNWIAFNKAYPKFFGYSEKELYGMNPRMLMHQEDIEKYFQAFKDLVGGKTSNLRQERRYIHKTGKSLYAIASGVVVRNDQGMAKYIVVALQDITKRKYAEDILKESEMRFRRLADTAPVLIWMVDQDKKRIYFNKRWLDFVGQTGDEVSGDEWMKRICEDDAAHYLNVFNAAFVKREPFSVEYRLKNAVGEYRWIVDNAVPLFTPENLFSGYIGGCIDIHEQKLAEERKDDFIGMASHELKTPLTSMKAYIEILRVRLKKGDINSLPLFVDKIENQTSKLTRLVNELLDISRIQTGKLSYDFEYFDLTDLIQEIVESMKEVSSNHTFDVKNNLKMTVWGDKNRIYQVITNILNNAIKYSPEGDGVIISVASTVDEVVVSVQDFGIGISKEHQNHIFDRLYQVTGTTEKTFPGLGIGLFISNEIVKRHGGRMWVNSDVGKGSTFYFSIPNKKETI